MIISNRAFEKKGPFNTAAGSIQGLRNVLHLLQVVSLQTPLLVFFKRSPSNAQTHCQKHKTLGPTLQTLHMVSFPTATLSLSNCLSCTARPPVGAAAVILPQLI